MTDTEAPLSVRWGDMDDRARREYWAGLALRHCRGLGARSCCRLLRHFGSAFAALEGRERWADAGVDRGKAAEISTGSWRVTARTEWDAVRDLDAVIVQWHEAAYPALLRTLPDAPVLLYCMGDLSLLANPAVAVIGSRKATPRGQALAGHMAGAFASWGITVVSGMAWGIDKAAHEAALDRTGSSIAVLGTGIDVPYPRANIRLYDRMAAKGLLVSEFAPGIPALRENFPIRNRIISGLSLGVIVVEAASRSGTLITSRLALEQGREVYAVPGAALSGQSLGCQELVRQGAKPVFAPEDVLEDLAGPLRDFGVQAEHLTREAAERRRRAEAEGTGLSRTLFACMPPETDAPARKVDPGDGEGAPAQGTDGETDTAAPAQDNIVPLLREQGPLHVDALGAALGRSPAELAPVLLGLEIMGRIRRLPGARYEAV
ncbi:MAG TPA: DNA-protecting protein DprA [Desulfovibrio piger]|uniref:DNA protecting protein DprA n=1 Tax=Desulfovibrio piger ATCC 29098 TaxID=411464 RepID=B6WSE7_9BACT|nr:DNA-processing protein DprA [Desulfovibrio piger]EEB34102.1 DNA protecting protein DprA [Desulfovibrio piger ATCC 29098]HCZ44388.1 DNA-protecting protein DprA [Desulfovibrio piger]